MKFARKVVTLAVAALLLACVCGAAFAADAVTYRRMDEVFDWGVVTRKLIVDLGQNVTQRAVDLDTFSVYVYRTDERVDPALVSEGDRTVTKVYVSDADGKQVARGRYVTLTLAVAPDIANAIPINYAAGRNVWIDCKYVIEQKKPIRAGKNTIEGLKVTEMSGRATAVVDEFMTGKSAFTDPKWGEIALPYAAFAPADSGRKQPLLVWLHGGGEGGSDATIPLVANKVKEFACAKTQNLFGGLFLLVPQAPTKWMDEGNTPNITGGTKKDASSMYALALKALIDEYVAANSARIDTNRIYVGGLSNGGFMTFRMLLDYPDYFAAAVPVCEGINDKFLTDEDIERIKNVPMWFVSAATDGTLPAPLYTVPLYDRLIKAGAPHTYISYYQRVVDQSGRYTKEDGTPYEYNGHHSWIYVYNNDPSLVIDGSKVSILQWLAAQKK